MSRLRSNKVVNQAGSGAPELTYGAVIPNTGTISGAGKVSIGGSITAGSFHGDGSGLSGVGDPSALKVGSNVKIQAQPSGATVTGILTVTNDIDASDISGVNATFSGNATVQGNLTVNGTTTTIDTAVTEVDSLAIDGLLTTLGSVGIGTTNPTRKLHLHSGITDTAMLIESTDADAQINFKDANSGDGVSIGVRGDDFYIRTGLSTERLRVKSNGDVTLSGTGSLKVPVGTTGERPTPAAGMFRYNTTEGKFEGYTTEWGEIGGGGGGLTTAAHVANNAVVTLDLTAAVDHKVTATGICTITCTGGTEAQSHTIRIINSGSATVGFSTYFLFPSGNTPVLTSTDGAINLISFTVNRVGAAGTQLLAGASLNFS